MTLDSVMQLVEQYGLILLAPMAVVEGPIVTVIAAYLARLGYLEIVGVYVVCVLGDLVGDAIWYGLGRFGMGILSPRWQARLGMNDARQLALTSHFAEKGGRTLLLGKWTHSAGMPILVASGVARMNFGMFMLYNLVATLPKTLVFVLLGYFIGSAYALIDAYIFRASLVLLLILVAGGLFWAQRKGWHKQ